MARYVQYTKERDAQALADMYTDPADWTELGVTQSLSRAEIKTLFEGVFLVVTEVYDSRVYDVDATVSGDTAVVEFTWMQDVYNSVLEQRLQSQGAKTWTLQRIGGQWYISHDVAHGPDPGP